MDSGRPLELGSHENDLKMLNDYVVVCQFSFWMGGDILQVDQKKYSLPDA